jgi:hypothetical protein
MAGVENPLSADTLVDQVAIDPPRRRRRGTTRKKPPIPSYFYLDRINVLILYLIYMENPGESLCRMVRVDD